MEAIRTLRLLDSGMNGMDLMHSTIKKIKREELRKVLQSNYYVAKCLYHKKENINQSTSAFYPIRYRLTDFGIVETKHGLAIFISEKVMDYDNVACHLKLSNGEIVLSIPNVCRYVIKHKVSLYHKDVASI